MKTIQFKIIAVALIMTLIIPNFAFATMTYEKNAEDPDIADVATYISTEQGSETYVDSKYDAESIAVPLQNISIYNYNEEYNENEKKTATSNGEEITYSGDNKGQYFYSIEEATIGDGEEAKTLQYLNYTIKLAEGNQTGNDIATFIYKDAIKCNNKLCDLKINIKKVNKEGTNPQQVRVRIGKREKPSNSDETKYNLGTYDQDVGVTILGQYCEGNKLEVELECFAIGEDKKSTKIAGLLGITDIDLNQGTFIKGYKPDNEDNKNLYARNNEYISDIKYKVQNDGTYIYTTNTSNTEGHDVYALIDTEELNPGETDDKTKINLTFTFDDKNAGSAIKFYGNDNNVIKRYKKIITKVTSGTETRNNNR